MNKAQESSMDRTAGIEWTVVGLLIVNLAWTTLCLGGYRPETMVVTNLLTGVILIVHFLGRAWVGGAVKYHRAGWLFLPFLAYAAINVIWVTPVRWLGWHDWYWWAQMGAVFWVVLNGVERELPRRVLMGAMAAIGFVAVIMAAYQRFVQPDWLMMGRVQSDQFIGRSSGPFGIPNSLAALLILLTPAVGVLVWRHRSTAVQRVLFGYLVLCYLAGLVLTMSRGGMLAFALALMIWPVVAWKRSWWMRLGAMLVIGLGLCAAGWGWYQCSPMARDRVDHLVAESGEWTRPVMWKGAWELFSEHPWTGSGAGSYNVLFEKTRPPVYQLEPQWVHNDYLNTLSDYGSIGFVLCFGAVAAMLVMVWRSRKTRQVGRRIGPAGDMVIFWQAVAVGLLAFAMQLFVDFHLKIPALAMFVGVILALWIRQLWPSDRDGEGRRRWGCRIVLITVAAGVGLGMGLGSNPHYRAEALRYSARQSMDTLWRQDSGGESYRAILEKSRKALYRATAIDATNAQAWADLSLAISLQAHVEPDRKVLLGQQALIEADRALALSTVVPEFWIRRAVAKDMQGDWLSAGDDLIQAMRLAPASASTWYFQAYHLSLRATGLQQARAAVNYCLRLDPAHVTAQRLRQQLATDD